MQTSYTCFSCNKNKVLINHTRCVPCENPSNMILVESRYAAYIHERDRDLVEREVQNAWYCKYNPWYLACSELKTLIPALHDPETLAKYQKLRKEIDAQYPLYYKNNTPSLVQFLRDIF